MNKIKILVIVIVATFIFGVIFSLNTISKASNMDILTKNTIFDIINNVEDVIITCISTDGQKNLDSENKFDSTLLYIIKHKDDYNIVDENPNLDLNSQMCIIGKVSLKDFENEFKNIFENFRHKISEYKYFDGKYITLVYEPCEPFIYDYKELLYSRNNGNGYEVVYRYVRKLNEVENVINVKYVFNSRMKIKDVIILSSNIR